jgi:hypothetical protein
MDRDAQEVQGTRQPSADAVAINVSRCLDANFPLEVRLLALAIDLSGRELCKWLRHSPQHYVKHPVGV